MRKAFLLLTAFLMLSLASCAGDSATGEVVKEIESLVKDVNDTVKNGTSKFKVPELFAPVDDNTVTEDVLKESSPKELLEKFREQQKGVYSKRSDVLNRMREVSRNLYDEDVSFEDKEFYQKAYDILKKKKSELTLEATLLDSDIERLEKKAEAEESIAQARQDLAALRGEREELVAELRVLGDKVYTARAQWLNSLFSEDFEDVDERVRDLEEEHADSSDRLRSVVEEIKEKEETISELEDYELSEDRKDLIIKRQGIVEELGVVRNNLVEKYMELSGASSSVKDSIERAISELEKKENELRDELRFVSDKLKD